jgi:hypothetical protein
MDAADKSYKRYLRTIDEKNRKNNKLYKDFEPIIDHDAKIRELEEKGDSHEEIQKIQSKKDEAMKLWCTIYHPETDTTEKLRFVEYENSNYTFYTIEFSDFGISTNDTKTSVNINLRLVHNTYHEKEFFIMSNGGDDEKSLTFEGLLAYFKGIHASY